MPLAVHATFAYMTRYINYILYAYFCIYLNTPLIHCTVHTINVHCAYQENLCGMWRVSGGILSRLVPGLRAPSLRLKLQSHLHYIYTTDWLVNLEGGLSHLQKKDLEKVHALY